jgi:hypothetical protein
MYLSSETARARFVDLSPSELNRCKELAKAHGGKVASVPHGRSPNHSGTVSFQHVRWHDAVSNRAAFLAAAKAEPGRLGLLLEPQ